MPLHARSLMGLILIMLVMGCHLESGFAMSTARQVLTVDTHANAPKPGIGGDLALRNVDGRHFSLASLGERQALVFFGFTRCSSVCPMALYQVRQLLSFFQARTPPAIIFVTLDPLNDDGPALARYLAPFDHRIMGLTGPPDEVFKVARSYAVATDTSSGQIEHSAKWYLVNARGQVLRVYDLATPPQEVARDILAHVKPDMGIFKRTP